MELKLRNLTIDAKITCMDAETQLYDSYYYYYTEMLVLLVLDMIVLFLIIKLTLKKVDNRKYFVYKTID